MRNLKFIMHGISNTKKMTCFLSCHHQYGTIVCELFIYELVQCCYDLPDFIICFEYFVVQNFVYMNSVCSINTKLNFKFYFSIHLRDLKASQMCISANFVHISKVQRESKFTSHIIS